MDAMKQRWINELAKYDFSLEYQKGKNNTVADALSRISKECLSDEEAEKVLEVVPMIPGDDTVNQNRSRVATPASSVSGHQGTLGHLPPCRVDPSTRVTLVWK